MRLIIEGLTEPEINSLISTFRKYEDVNSIITKQFKLDVNSKILAGILLDKDSNLHIINDEYKIIFKK